ncbi:MAG TPA: NUDIX domain-containing protein [Candidatus Omnitrophota bacterium]|mgnify:CR=1 FL=1|nr:NUDIX domain-containing protein [Candidatus Omnitrophota bacterium]HPS19906.1 NUDIX domain-containing protein [Candidatus Omnitrophota bacterium]
MTDKTKEEKHFSSGGVVMREENGKPLVLLIKDQYGHWTWPKGHMEGSETPEETAIRETAEETGIENVRVIKKLGEQKYRHVLHGVKIFKTVYIFLMQTVGDGKLSLQAAEVADGRWFAPQDALKTIEYRGSKDLLEKGIKSFCSEILKVKY